MSSIVCAIRGGPDSQPTIHQAIVLSKETGLPIYFLYVVNLDFLSHTSSSHLQTISKEMNEMGQFILMTAQATAEAQGATAHSIVRHGNVEHEIINLSLEVQATFIVLGRPQAHREESRFLPGALTHLIERIEQQTGGKVILPDGGH